MKVNTYKQQNQKTQAFQARNAQIRLADSVVRKVNHEFPMFSWTKGLEIYDRNNKLMSDALNNQYLKLAEHRRFPLESAPRTVNIVKYTKKDKIGNCKEAAVLAKLGADINGIPNTQLYGLRAYKKYWFWTKKVNLDHAILIADLDPKTNLKNYKKFNKKAYVMDAWNGFADYIYNAFSKYEIDNAKYLKHKFKNTKNVTIGIEPIEKAPTLTKRLLNLLVPELKIQKALGKTKELPEAMKKAS